MEIIKQNRILFTIEGVLFIILGALAIAWPRFFTVGFEQFIGWLFVFIGIVQGYRLFTSYQLPGAIPSLLSTIVYLVIGGLLIAYPVQGVLTLTMLLIAYFFIEGVAKIYLSFYLKPMQNWGLFLFSGVISIMMALLILSGWPGTAVWVIGLLLGINMIFFGFVILDLCATANRLDKP